MSDEYLIPATRDADGNVTIHSERLQVTPVDEALYARIVPGDVFINRLCCQCGSHAGLFVVAGRFVNLCPRCVVYRLLKYAEEVFPRWMSVLDEEARRELASRERKEKSELTVDWEDVYRCARCRVPIRREDAQYWRAPGETTSPPYCQTCADALRESERKAV